MCDNGILGKIRFALFLCAAFGIGYMKKQEKVKPDGGVSPYCAWCYGRLLAADWRPYPRIERASGPWFVRAVRIFGLVPRGVHGG